VFKVEELGSKGAWQVQSPIYSNQRRLFRDWFKQDKIKQKACLKLDIDQASCFVSKKHLAHGIHTNRMGYKQKVVNLVRRSNQDTTSDLRPPSQTFTKWISLALMAHDVKLPLPSERLEPTFLAMENDTLVIYGISEIGALKDGAVTNLLNPVISIKWPITDLLILGRNSTALVLVEVEL